MDQYLETTERIYKEAATHPKKGLCCTTSASWDLPDLVFPDKMLQMNYGCGSTVHPGDLIGNPTVLYVGVGGGLELLQFAYFTRSPNKVTGIDTVPEMLKACSENFEEAARSNPWFETNFVKLQEGSALDIPVEDTSIDVAAQNCLFNIFSTSHLETALSEMYRVLKPSGRLILSDPICDQPIPRSLRDNEELRALCLSGAIPLDDYLDIVTGCGFGTIEIRGRFPYRVLSKDRYELDKEIFLESIEVCAIKDPMPVDGPCIFTGRTALYFGEEEFYDDGKGHILINNQPLDVCDKTAESLTRTQEKIIVTPSTYFYRGGGCC